MPIASALARNRSKLFRQYLNQFGGDPPLPVVRLTPATGHRVIFCMSEKILLVDDDPAVRRMFTRILAEEGYKVFAAADSHEATQLNEREQVDLVVLGLNAAALDFQVWDQIGCAQPALPFILTADEKTLPASLSRASTILEKPWDFLKLLQIIQERLLWRRFTSLAPAS